MKEDKIKKEFEETASATDTKAEKADVNSKADSKSSKEKAEKADTKNKEVVASVADSANATDSKSKDLAVASTSDYSDIDMDVEDEVDLQEETEQIQAEFAVMDNVINGTKRKQKKKKKKMSKQGKLIEYGALACVCVALISVVAYFLSMFLGATPPSQAMDSSKLIVDMTERAYYFGTNGNVDLKTTFPNGSNFKITEGASKATSEGKLTIVGTEPFTLTLDETVTNEETGATTTTQKTITCNVIEGAVNVSTWQDLRKISKEGQIICMQNDVESPELFGEKRADHGPIEIKNDIYGNGKIINVCEIVRTRSKASSKKYGLPYVQGNGKVWGETGISLQSKENGEQLIFQDVHVTGNNMSKEGAPFGSESEEVQTTADGDEAPAKRGNMAGLTEEQEKTRGVLLFSRYGDLVSISGSEDEKIEVRLEHCVFEKSGKVLHVTAANMEMEGCIIRDAADTALSIGTYKNKASYIKSSNNVIANSLTGGILFYCFDDQITAGNAEATWNTLEIMPGTFLDIFNWKDQNGLAFLPETEDFANIANPIAASEIPKKSYDALKGKDESGNLYIHFAIIKIRTGNGLPQNGSTVKGYKDLQFGNVKEGSNGEFTRFPIPQLANAIMKELDVWGYYGVSDGDVTPTLKLGQDRQTGLTDWEKFYRELRDGRDRTATNNN